MNDQAENLRRLVRAQRAWERMKTEPTPKRTGEAAVERRERGGVGSRDNAAEAGRRSG